MAFALEAREVLIRRSDSAGETKTAVFTVVTCVPPPIARLTTMLAKDAGQGASRATS